LEIVKLGL